MKKHIGNYLKKYLDNSPNPIGLMIVWLTIFFFVCEGLVKLFNIWWFYYFQVLLFSSFGFCVLLICVIGCSFDYSSDRLIQKIESGEMHIQKSGYKVMNGDTTILYTVKSKNKDDE